MNKRRLTKGLVCLVLVAAIFIAMPYSRPNTLATVTQGDIDELREKQNELEANEAALDADLEEAKKNVDEQRKYCDALQAKIDNQQQEIDVLLQSISALNSQISDKESQIADVQADIDSDTERLRQRIKALYLAGDTTTLEIILGAKSFDDLQDKTYLMKTISDADAELVDGLNKNMNSIRDEKELIEADKAELLDQKSKLETKMSELNSLQAECNAVLAQLEGYEQEIVDRRNANISEQGNLTDQLTELEQEYANQLAAQNATQGSSADPYAYVSSGSGYCWPAPQCSYITAYWGDGRGHRGIDLACAGSAYGLPIVAAQSGTVTIANSYDSWGSGWGYHIKIDHGSGYATLYAHCSSVIVSEGQSVERGELIGYIGNTGDSYGSHLHFECWYNGVRYDPMTELS